MKFSGKVVIVTAASTGIGRETAITFAKEGAEVLLLARREEKLLETKNLIENEGGKTVGAGVITKIIK